MNAKGTKNYDLSEARLEQYLIKEIRLLGGISRKFCSPNYRGVPDRIVIWPGGVVHFVELKTEKGKLTKLQKSEQRKLKEIGCTVYTLYGLSDIRSYLSNTKNTKNA